jgi:hypothetical protein
MFSTPPTHPLTAMYSAPRTQLARINTPTYPPPCSPPHQPTHSPPCSPPHALSLHGPTHPSTHHHALHPANSTCTRPPPCSPPHALSLHESCARLERDTPRWSLLCRRKTPISNAFASNLTPRHARYACAYVSVCACVLCVLVHNSSVQACDSVHHECHNLSSFIIRQVVHAS